MLFHSVELVLGFTLFLLLEDVCSQDCGQKRANARASSVWPWMVAIKQKGSQGYYVQGTGFLIDHIHILTVASIIWNPQTSLYQASISNADHTRGKRYGIVRIQTHPDFRKNNSGSYNDIAILTLDRPVCDDPDFNPVCLPNKDIRGLDLNNVTTTIVGWGQNLRGESINILQQLRGLPVVPNRDCERAFQNIMDMHTYKLQFPSGIYNRQMCTGFAEGRKEACIAVVGGPLMIERNDTWYIIGISSFGLGCGHPGVPSGYTKVSEYWDWILESAWN